MREEGDGGAPIGKLMADNVPGLGFRTTGASSFDGRQTATDTLHQPVPSGRAADPVATPGLCLAERPGHFPRGAAP